MSTGKRTFTSIIFYISIAGVVIFAAVFFGIRAGLAVRASGALGITVENLTNSTQLVIGQKVPNIDVFTEHGRIQPLRSLCQGENTVIAFLMPGCGPCANLIDGWRNAELYQAANGYRVILVAATSDDVSDIEEIREIGADFPLYLCDFATLNASTGIETFPTIFGISGDTEIAFISSGYNRHIGNAFFTETFSR